MISVGTTIPEDNYDITISLFPFTGTDIKAYWGWINNDGSMLVEAQIVVLSGNGTSPTGQTITADFRGGNSTPSYLYMAERATEPIKTKWYGSGLDQGNIGPGLTFSVIGVIAGWRVYRSGSKTTFSTTTEFRTA